MNAPLMHSVAVVTAGAMSPAVALQCAKPSFVEVHHGEQNFHGLVLCPVSGIYNNYAHRVPGILCDQKSLTVGDCFDYVDHSCGTNSTLRLTSFERKFAETDAHYNEPLGGVELYAFECTAPGKDIQ